MSNVPKVLYWFPVWGHLVSMPLLVTNGNYVAAWFAFVAAWFAFEARSYRNKFS